MVSIQEQIQAIEKEIRETPYHKGTEHHIGKLRARLAKLKDMEFEHASQKGTRGGYAVKKQGDATVVLIGPPSSGKSTLINKLTNTKSRVAPYAFTTVTVIPGMMIYKDAKIQVLDVPGLIEGAEEGKGRGREVLSVARGADLIILITDVDRIKSFDRIQKTLERNGIRLNIVRPNVIFKKKASGGIIIHSNIKQDISNNTIKEVASEMGIKNAEISVNEKLTLDRLIDALSTNRAYIPAIFVVNKVDLGISSDKELIHRKNPILISAEKSVGLDQLREVIWKKLNFARVYLVRPNEEPNFNNPIVMKSNQILYDVLQKLGTEFQKKYKKAKIWGTGSKFPGQEVSLSTQVVDGMQIRFI